MYIIFLAALLFLNDVYGDRSEICTPLNGVDRTCMRYQDCPKDIRDLLAMRNRPANLTKQLRDAICGAPISRKLCCPTPECYTWDGRPGVCVNFGNNSDLFPEDITYRQLKLSACTKINRKGTFICYSDLPIRQIGDCDSDKSAFPPDPSYGCCGQERTAYKIIGAIAPKIDQFPWLAVLKYAGDRKNCTGVLISGKYVLTAARCVASADLQPYAVVLGEYNKRTEVDCDSDDDCGDPVVTIDIEDIKIHPGFNTACTLWRNDIALIRLQKMVEYSDFILPICLPIDYMDATNMLGIEFNLVAVGWGSADPISHRPSDVKLMVDLPFVNRSVCLASHPSLGRKHLCAGGDPNLDTCIGEPGSPLMNDRLGSYEVLGIASYDSSAKCGRDGKPGVYTKVYSYLNWIHSNIRP